MTNNNKREMAELSYRDLVKNFSSDLENVDLSLIDTKINDLEAKSVGTDEDKINELSVACADHTFIDPQWAILSGRLQLFLLRRVVKPTFSEATEELKPRLSESYYGFVMANRKRLDDMIVHRYDLKFNLFAIETMKKSYLLKLVTDDQHIEKLCEVPQYMYLRLAIQIWYDTEDVEGCLEKIQEVYQELALGSYTHASPTMFSAGLKKFQGSSCFLDVIEDDLINISNGWLKSALISKHCGGIGKFYGYLRHSEIANAGSSKGITPWAQIENQIMRTVDQGGMRKGSQTSTLPVWHIDIQSFIDLRRKDGKEEERARDLFYCVSYPDLFMERVLSDEYWTLFCPKKASGLADKFGEEFEHAYLHFEKKFESGKMPGKRLSARSLWKSILENQAREGMPFHFYPDAANRKSNQVNLGTTKTSNLCTEIVEYAGPGVVASCNLASISLPNLLVRSKENANKWVIDYQKLDKIGRQLVRNLNQVIDRNFYPAEIPEIKKTNMMTRPLGIGCQGFADLLALMDIPWVVPNTDDPTDVLPIANPEALKINSDIWEALYYATLSESIQMAKELEEKKKNAPRASNEYINNLIQQKTLLEQYSKLRPDDHFLCREHQSRINDIDIELETIDLKRGYYARFPGSPASKGFFQFDLWDKEAFEKQAKKGQITDKIWTPSSPRTSKFDWATLRKEMMEYGMVNSLLLTQMPTASTAQILGNNEMCEPFSGLMFTRKVLSGKFLIVNRYMVDDLREIGLWNSETVRHLIENKYSLSSFSIPENDSRYERVEFLKRKYLTVWELPQDVMIDFVAERGRFICQSQSFNCYFEVPDAARLSAFHLRCWERGLKTSYYIRSGTQAEAINVAKNTLQFGTQQKSVRRKNVECTGEVCIMCSS